MSQHRIITIKYQIPGITAGGDLLDEARFEFPESDLAVSISTHPPSMLQQHTLERVASAASVLARQLHIRRATLGLCLHFADRQRPYSITHSSPNGETVIEMTFSSSWRRTLAFELFRASDVNEGRFPSMHPAAQVPWVDLLWSMSLAGRMEGRVRRRVPEADTRTIGKREIDADIRKDRTELTTALLWKAKHDGLSLTRMDGETIANKLWGSTPTLKETAELGMKYGLRLHGPLASVPMSETWRAQPRKRPVTSEHA